MVVSSSAPARAPRDRRRNGRTATAKHSSRPPQGAATGAGTSWNPRHQTRTQLRGTTLAHTRGRGGPGRSSALQDSATTSPSARAANLLLHCRHRLAALRRPLLHRQWQQPAPAAPAATWIHRARRLGPPAGRRLAHAPPGRSLLLPPCHPLSGLQKPRLSPSRPPPPPPPSLPKASHGASLCLPPRGLSPSRPTPPRSPRRRQTSPPARSAAAEATRSDRPAAPCPRRAAVAAPSCPWSRAHPARPAPSAATRRCEAACRCPAPAPHVQGWGTVRVRAQVTV